MAGLASKIARSEIRPDIVAGPMERKCSLSNSCATEVAAIAPCAWTTSGAHNMVHATSEAVRRCSVLIMEGVSGRRGTAIGYP